MDHSTPCGLWVGSHPNLGVSPLQGCEAAFESTNVVLIILGFLAWPSQAPTQPAESPFENTQYICLNRIGYLKEQAVFKPPQIFQMHYLHTWECVLVTVRYSLVQVPWGTLRAGRSSSDVSTPGHSHSSTPLVCFQTSGDGSGPGGKVIIYTLLERGFS